jgi:hypothetical protein
MSTMKNKGSFMEILWVISFAESPGVTYEVFRSGFLTFLVSVASLISASFFAGYRYSLFIQKSKEKSVIDKVYCEIHPQPDPDVNSIKVYKVIGGRAVDVECGYINPNTKICSISKEKCGFLQY